MQKSREKKRDEGKLGGERWRNCAVSKAKPQLQCGLILTDNDGKSPLRVKLSPSMRQRFKTTPLLFL